MFTATRNSVFLDTSAFIAFLDASDEHHPFYVELFGGAPSLITSSEVIFEGHTWFLRKYGVEIALQFLDFIKSLPRFRVESSGLSEIKEAEKYLRKFRDQPLTLVDALGLYLMDRHRIATVWSTDRHMTLTGRKAPRR